MLSLKTLREQAKKLKIHLGAAGRVPTLTVQEIVENKRRNKEEAKKKAEKEEKELRPPQTSQVLDETSDY